jgi:hypothetical protein
VEEGIQVADFVVMNRPGAGTVGLVYRVKAGFAYVWWRERDKPDGRPQTIGDKHATSELKFVEDPSYIPPSMIFLRQENFPHLGTFRTRPS